MSHQMDTSSALLSLCEGNPPVTGGFLSQRPVTQSFGVFFDLCMNKILSKRKIRQWCETSSRSLWRHCNVAITFSPMNGNRESLYKLCRHMYHRILFLSYTFIHIAIFANTIQIKHFFTILMSLIINFDAIDNDQLNQQLNISNRIDHNDVKWASRCLYLELEWLFNRFSKLTIKHQSSTGMAGHLWESTLLSGAERVSRS